MKFIKVSNVSDFNGKNKVRVDVEGRDILIVKLDEEYFAIDNRCTHMGGSLFDGDIKGDLIVCPKHKAEFNIRSGKGVKDGKILFIKAKISDLNRYNVKVENEDILVEVE